MVFGEVVDAPEIEPGAAHTADRVRRLIENLTAQGQMVGDLALEQPADELTVFVSAARVDPMATYGEDPAEHTQRPGRQRRCAPKCDEDEGNEGPTLMPRLAAGPSRSSGWFNTGRGRRIRPAT
jgi:hypothetical protein